MDTTGFRKSENVEDRTGRPVLAELAQAIAALTAVQKGPRFAHYATEGSLEDPLAAALGIGDIGSEWSYGAPMTKINPWET